MHADLLALPITFFTALWSLRKDSHGWRDAMEGAGIAVLIAVSIFAAIKGDESYIAYKCAIGLLVGFIGSERIRAAIVGAWESGKIKIVRKQHGK